MTRTRIALLWLTSIAVGIVAALLVNASEAAPSAPATTTFDTITVHRINVVEADGKPRVIITNKQRFPGAIFDGVEYPHPGRNVGGGMLFFNDDGTEAGGLAYMSEKTKDGKAAGALLTMDQLNQNETLSLSYEEENGKRGAGLVVYADHPDKSLRPLVEAEAAAKAAVTPEDKKRTQARVDQLTKETLGNPQAKRVFVGREVDDAMLVLGDKAGNPRIVLKVDGRGEPSVEFLDAKGKTTKKITDKP